MRHWGWCFKLNARLGNSGWPEKKQNKTKHVNRQERWGVWTENCRRSQFRREQDNVNNHIYIYIIDIHIKYIHSNFAKVL